MITSSAAIGISRVAVATLLVNAVQNTAMHDTRNTIRAGSSVFSSRRAIAISSDNLECCSTALADTFHTSHLISSMGIIVNINALSLLASSAQYNFVIKVKALTHFSTVNILLICTNLTTHSAL